MRLRSRSTVDGEDDTHGGVFHRKWIGDTIRWQSGLTETPDTSELSIEFHESFIPAHPRPSATLRLEIQEAFCNYPLENGLVDGAPSIADKTVD
ncbi:MAG: hypothetical protein HN529_01270 [Acidiferrobacteraceae bacterium]|nr:hypothetical protein [Acidiferrobacteraceae bacterium]MBT3638906.1 hypothetical protein [Acidiferrobacteraceae bacterium]MBT4405709.1 hypothetical protein [Acidiferrobacteraceae bacterium]MBT4806358.1 hypothetical protein [Acidiferrobacteraceae bacterium]MBT5344064.1 hypothetical protein [Acidiferrobacteraceae bacterium]